MQSVHFVDVSDPVATAHVLGGCPVALSQIALNISIYAPSQIIYTTCSGNDNNIIVLTSIRISCTGL